MVNKDRQLKHLLFLAFLVVIGLFTAIVKSNAQSTQEEVGKWIYFQTPENKDAFVVKVTDRISNGYIVTLYAGNINNNVYPNFAMSSDFANDGEKITNEKALEYLKKWGYDNR